MTIAAGFLCKGGALLCADTEETGWAMKIQAPKLNHFECAGGKLAFGYAGHVTFAVSAIQKCKAHLARVPADRILTELEAALEKEYRRHVLRHPDHATNANLDYRLLIAVWCLGKPVRLFVTEQTALREVADYECIGLGDYLAHYLIRPSFSLGMEERPTFSLAAYMLANVKGFVPNCGGRSQFLLMREGGMVAVVESLPDIEPFSGIEWLERKSKDYDEFAKQLLFSVVNPDINQPEFEEVLAAFDKRVQDLRREWREGKTIHESFARFKVVSEPDPGAKTVVRHP